MELSLFISELRWHQVWRHELFVRIHLRVVCFASRERNYVHFESFREGTDVRPSAE